MNITKLRWLVHGIPSVLCILALVNSWVFWKVLILYLVVHLVVLTAIHLLFEFSGSARHSLYKHSPPGELAREIDIAIRRLREINPELNHSELCRSMFRARRLASPPNAIGEHKFQMLKAKGFIPTNIYSLCDSIYFIEGAYDMPTLEYKESIDAMSVILDELGWAECRSVAAEGL